MTRFPFRVVGDSQFQPAGALVPSQTIDLEAVSEGGLLGGTLSITFERPRLLGQLGRTLWLSLDTEAEPPIVAEPVTPQRTRREK